MIEGSPIIQRGPIRQLPLHLQHEGYGTQFKPYGEWSLPESYGDPVEEYRAAREKVAVIDLSHDGQALLSGEDRTDFLQNLMSQDIHQARDGQGIFSTFLTAKGKVISDFYLYPLPEAYFIETEATIAEKTFQHLMRFRLRSKIKIETPRWGKLAVCGPQAKSFLDEQIKISLPREPPSFLMRETDPVLVIRRTQTGEDDYILYSHLDKMGDLFTHLLSAGERWGIKRVGQAALEILRIEAGLLRYGTDLDEDRIPIEAGLEESAISYTKGCYPGQEVIARIKTYGHVNWHLRGLILQGTDVPRYQDLITNGNQEVGRVTSGVYSPLCHAPIAMAYLRTEFACEGTSVQVAIGPARVCALVTALPFRKWFRPPFNPLEVPPR